MSSRGLCEIDEPLLAIVTVECGTWIDVVVFLSISVPGTTPV